MGTQPQNALGWDETKQRDYGYMVPLKPTKVVFPGFSLLLSRVEPEQVTCAFCASALIRVTRSSCYMRRAKRRTKANTRKCWKFVSCRFPQRL